MWSYEVKELIPYPNIDPVLIQIGPIAVRWYSLAYLIGVVGAVQLLKKTFSTQFNLNSDDLMNLMTNILAGILIGGRIGYTLFYGFDYFLDAPLSIFKLWEGGMSFHGGAIGALIGMTLFCKKHTHLPLRTGFDFLALGSTLGIFLGRLANFINGELYGRITTVPWAMIFPDGGPLPRHPSQLYEAFFEGIVLFLILYRLFQKNTLKPGQLFSVFLIFYGLFRFGIEFFRQPDAQLGFVLGPLSMGQVLSSMMIGLGVLGFVSFKKTNQPHKC